MQIYGKMNFGEEDVLDFEEDLLEMGKIDNMEEEKDLDEENDVNSFDQYLQIDCSEDEEGLLEKVVPETEKVGNSVQDTESTNKEPLNEENEKAEETKAPAKNVPADNQRKNFGKIHKKKGKGRNFGAPFYKNPGFVSSKRWRPYNNYKKITRQNNSQRANQLKGMPLRYPNHLHHFSQSYLQNQNEFVSLLGLRATRNKNMQKMAYALCSSSVMDVRKNFVGNAIMEQCNNTIINQFQINDISRFKGIIAQKLSGGINNQKFPARCITNGFQHNFNRGSFNEGEPEKVQEQVVTHTLPEGQKELVKSKKEARLIRFMNDQTPRKENTTEKPVNKSLQFEDEYFRKMEEQKRKREEIFSLKEKVKPDHGEGTPEQMTINKELLLKKENPFEDFKLALSTGSTLRPQVKVEKKGDANQSGSSIPEIKKEVESPVKFFRTVSKSFEELGLSKTKSGHFSGIENESDRNLDWDLIFENVPKVQLVDAASQTQAELHLTGCIVKVFNIPPSTTANDILALCNSVGIVREVKFNFPKENSVAIRFSEPKSAENFFKLYHGRVVKNHTLNVITV